MSSPFCSSNRRWEVHKQLIDALTVILEILKAYLNKDHIQLPNVHLFFLKSKNKQEKNEPWLHHLHLSKLHDIKLHDNYSIIQNLTHFNHIAKAFKTVNDVNSITL